MVKHDVFGVFSQRFPRTRFWVLGRCRVLGVLVCFHMKVLGSISKANAPTHIFFKFDKNTPLTKKYLKIYSSFQKLFKFAKIIQVCKNYSSLQKLFKFAKIIQVYKNYSSLQKLFKFAKIIQVYKNYSSLQKLFKFTKIIQVCKNYSSLQKLFKFA